MKTLIKVCLTTLVCALCVSAIAEDRFIIKYKLNEWQKYILSEYGGADKEKHDKLIRFLLMERLSKEQVDALSKAAGVQAQDWHSLGNGAHVIALSKDLDEKQTEQFIRNVEQDKSVEYIEVDAIIDIVGSSTHEEL